jgi:hypothetical protein
MPVEDFYRGDVVEFISSEGLVVPPLMGGAGGVTTED